MKDRQFNHPTPSIDGRCTRVNRAFALSNARKSRAWAAHRRTVASLDRLSTKNPRRGAPKTPERPARASRSWSPDQALIEFDLRWWLSGLLPVRIVARRWRRRDDRPQRWSAGRGEARRPGGFPEVLQDLPHGARLGHERDAAHRGVTERAGQWENEVSVEANAGFIGVKRSGRS
jgi:hypothetical protein